MGKDHVEVLIVGAGAAGIAAGKRLHDAGVDYLLVEARDRLGGRAWTVAAGPSVPLDLGCGWLHSADRNPWSEIARTQGRTIDKTPAPWMRPSLPIGFPLDQQSQFREAMGDLFEHVHAAGLRPDVPASSVLEPGGRWNGLINAVSTYINGAELEKVSTVDFARYEDSGTNWRVVEGYGTAIAAHEASLNVMLGAPVTAIDRGATPLRVETTHGTITADAVIVTVSSAILAEERLRFVPALPEKIEAASGLPLGLADKLFLSLAAPEEFKKDSRLFGRTDRTATATYHIRPFGRPLIEAYFGGALADQLESDGEGVFSDFAVAELTGLLGGSFASRVKPVATTRWRTDPFARGSYSYAATGRADDRAVLAAPVEGRLFFACEACSPNYFSTAHGAYLTGVVAADHAITAVRG